MTSAVLGETLPSSSSFFLLRGATGDSYYRICSATRHGRALRPSFTFGSSVSPILRALLLTALEASPRARV